MICIPGCTVYKSAPIAWDEAAKQEQKVRAISKSNEKLKLKRIGFEDVIYYGYRKLKREMVKVPLKKKTIDNIKEKDLTISTVANITASIVSFMGAILGIWLLAGSHL